MNTLEEFIQMFPTDELCRKYMVNLRWGNFASCPYCGNERAYFIEKGRRYLCADKDCKKKFSVTVKTLLESSQVPLDKWMVILFLYVKSSGRVTSHELCNTAEISQNTELRLRDTLNFCFPYVLRENRTTQQKIDDLFLSMVNLYDKYKKLKQEPYYTNPFIVKDIDNISDVRQYNVLLRYARYYINVYCKWIFIKIMQPEEVLTETFIRFSDEGVKEYNAELVVKAIQKTVGKMWYEYTKFNPGLYNQYQEKNKHFKKERRRKLTDSYVVERISLSKKYTHLNRNDIMDNKELIKKYRIEIQKKRAVRLSDNSDFISHLE